MTATVIPAMRFEVPDDLVARASTLSATSSSGVKELIGPFGPAFKCLAKATWKVKKLADLGITIPGVEVIPVSVEVEFGRICTNRLKKAVTDATASFSPTVVAAMTAGGIGPILAALGLAAAGGVSVGAGVTVGQVLAPAVLVLAAQAAIVAGQLIAYDAFNAAPNGITLIFPALPAIATGILNPVVGLMVLANTPVLVVPR